MRQCFRTASRDAYSRLHPGNLQVKRCVPPIKVILQQSTAAMLFEGSCGSPLTLGPRFFAVALAATAELATSTAIAHSTLAFGTGRKMRCEVASRLQV